MANAGWSRLRSSSCGPGPSTGSRPSERPSGPREWRSSGTAASVSDGGPPRIPCPRRSAVAGTVAEPSPRAGRCSTFSSFPPLPPRADPATVSRRMQGGASRGSLTAPLSRRARREANGSRQGRCAVVRCPAELESLDLPGGGLREIGDEVDPPRVLVGRDLVLDEGAELRGERFGRPRLILEDHVGARLHQPVVVLLPDHGGLEDRV